MSISLVEDVIGQITNQIGIVTRLEKTAHAGERQFRHGEPISDTDMKKTVEIGMPQVVKALIFNRIDIGNDVLIRNTRNDVNVVGHLAQDGSKLNFIIITVMRKQGFKAKQGTYTIAI